MILWDTLVVRSLCAVLPASEALPGLDPERTRAFLVRFRRESPLVLRLALDLSVLLFESSPLLTIGVPLPASLLSDERRDRHADRMARHRLYLVRQSMKMLKTSAGLVWGADAEVRAALGIPRYAADPDDWRCA